jgi:hypothetical protein
VLGTYLQIRLSLIKLYIAFSLCDRVISVGAGSTSFGAVLGVGRPLANIVDDPSPDGVASALAMGAAAPLNIRVFAAGEG